MDLGLVEDLTVPGSPCSELQPFPLPDDDSETATNAIMPPFDIAGTSASTLLSNSSADGRVIGPASSSVGNTAIIRRNQNTNPSFISEIFVDIARSGTPFGADCATCCTSTLSGNSSEIVMQTQAEANSQLSVVATPTTPSPGFASVSPYVTVTFDANAQFSQSGSVARCPVGNGCDDGSAGFFLHPAVDGFTEASLVEVTVTVNSSVYELRGVLGTKPACETVRFGLFVGQPVVEQLCDPANNVTQATVRSTLNPAIDQSEFVGVMATDFVFLLPTTSSASPITMSSDINIEGGLAGDANDDGNVDDGDFIGFDPNIATGDIDGPIGDGYSIGNDCNLDGVVNTADMLCIAAQTGSCVGDINRDGVFDVDDFSAFPQAFFAGDLRADVNGDGVLDIDDFSAFAAFTTDPNC
ncbi:MAG: GC-type dockerin domain-anchored protein [Planctomycetota bacterium]